MGSFNALAINKKLPTADKTTFGVQREHFLIVGPFIVEGGLTFQHRRLLRFGRAVP